MPLPNVVSQRWTIERDALGQPIRLDGPDDQRWQMTRNERGHPIDVTGPEGTTAFAYENASLPDRPTTLTDAVGASHQREYNALGQITAQTDCSQQRTTVTYDRHGYLASVTNALNETTRTQHDKMGATTRHPTPRRTLLAPPCGPSRAAGRVGRAPRVPATGLL